MKPQSDESKDAVIVSEITELQPTLRRFIGYLMSGASEVCDVAQEVNMLLWQKRDEFEVGTNFQAWAFTIARYRVLRHLRQKRKEGVFLFAPELVDQLADEWQADTDDHEKQLAALEYCLEKLPSDDLDLVRARYAAHGGVERFAEKLGQSGGSLRLRLFRLRAALKRCVEKQIEVEGGFE